MVMVDVAIICPPTVVVGVFVIVVAPEVEVGKSARKEDTVVLQKT